MAWIVAVVLGFGFGALDQYLGSRSALGAWAATVSGLSAPWLVLPFVAGMTQERSRRGMALGLVVILSALAGYFLMTYSPMENVPLGESLPGMLRMARTGWNPLWIGSAFVIGPLYGSLGVRWRVDRSWISAVLVTLAILSEPAARRSAGMLYRPPLVWEAELVMGALVALVFAQSILASRRLRQAEPHTVP
jgi:MFS family permease